MYKVNTDEEFYKGLKLTEKQLADLFNLFQNESAVLEEEAYEEWTENQEKFFENLKDILQEAKSRINPEDKKWRLYEIWAEGWASNEGASKAKLIGRSEGFSFKNACDLFRDRDEYFKKYYDRKELTHWGCKLFDNEADARESFG